jgi:hypothetical protein
MSQEFVWVAIAAVTIASAARVTRLLTFDHFPVVKWLRTKYANWTDGSDWQLLAFCGYCASFWVTLVIVLWGLLTDWQPAWWFVNGVLGASYLAAILMARDGDDEGTAR